MGPVGGLYIWHWGGNITIGDWGRRDGAAGSAEASNSDRVLRLGSYHYSPFVVSLQIKLYFGTNTL